jgi:hypothetical protein
LEKGPSTAIVQVILPQVFSDGSSFASAVALSPLFVAITKDFLSESILIAISGSPSRSAYT